MIDVGDRLILHASAYFATIQAGKDPGPVDPFLAGLIEEAIRERAGLATVPLAPQNGVNGVHKNGVSKPATDGIPEGLGASALTVFKIVQAAGSEGLMVAEVANRAGIPRVNAQFHCLALSRRKFLGKRGKGCYRNIWNGEGARVPVETGEISDGGMRAELARRGITHPGKLNVSIAKFAKAAGRDVTFSEMRHALDISSSSSMAKGTTPLLKAGLLKKLAAGVYAWVAA